MANWSFTEAKRKLEEIYRLAETEGPQRITRRGAEPLILLTESEYKRLKSDEPNFIEYLMNGPNIDDLELPSRNWEMRDVNL